MADTEAQQNAGIYESPEDAAKTKAGFVQRWIEAIELSSEEEKDWRKTSEEARQVYEAGEGATTGTAFNLYYSYIETVCPSLYNSTPIPDIRRRFNDKDPTAKEGADTIERVLSYSVDEYDFDDGFSDATFDLATTGRGVSRVKYIAELTETNGAQDVGAQSVECETVPWASFRRGPARAWKDVPWEAFAHYMDKASLKELNPDIDVPLNYHLDKSGEHKEGAEQDKPESDIFKRALVWEIWDKAKRAVYFIAPSYKDDVITTVEDPLGLKQFFCTPRPMMTGKASGRLVPLSPYKILKPQVKEIERLTVRINKLIKTLRPRGLGPGGVDLEKWASADDGQIVEVSDIAKWLQEGGAGAMDKLIAWFPMDSTVNAIQELYTRREQAKLEFFEVGGQADIMRGQSNPNETLGAQDIKANWGSLRLKKAQAEVQRFARDLFRLKAEIIAEKFTPQNLAMMTGINLTQPQPPQMVPGQQPDPAAMQQYQQAKQASDVAMQKFDAMIKLLKDDKMRGYRIDVETDSTIQGDKTRNQEAMAQFVQGTAQYFTAIAPVVEAGAVSMTAVVAIYSAFARNFKLGKEVDATLDQLAEQAAQQEQQKAQQPPPEDPEVVKAKAEAENNAAKQQSDAQQSAAKQQADAQHQQAEDQAKLVKTDGDSKAAVIKAQSDAAVAKQKQIDEHALKRELALLDAQLKRDIATDEAALKGKLAADDMKLKRTTSDNDHKIKAKATDEDIKIKAKSADADHKLKAEGKIGAPGQVNMKSDNSEVSKAISELGKLISKGDEMLLKAISAKRTVKTPSGGVYTSESA